MTVTVTVRQTAPTSLLLWREDGTNLLSAIEPILQEDALVEVPGRSAPRRVASTDGIHYDAEVTDSGPLRATWRSLINQRRSALSRSSATVVLGTVEGLASLGSAGQVMKTIPLDVRADEQPAVAAPFNWHSGRDTVSGTALVAAYLDLVEGRSDGSFPAERDDAWRRLMRLRVAFHRCLDTGAGLELRMQLRDAVEVLEPGQGLLVLGDATYRVDGLELLPVSPGGPTDRRRTVRGHVRWRKRRPVGVRDLVAAFARQLSEEGAGEDLAAPLMRAREAWEAAAYERVRAERVVRGRGLYHAASLRCFPHMSWAPEEILLATGLAPMLMELPDGRWLDFAASEAHVTLSIDPHGRYSARPALGPSLHVPEETARAHWRRFPSAGGPSHQGRYQGLCTGGAIDRFHAAAPPDVPPGRYLAKTLVVGLDNVTLGYRAINNNRLHNDPLVVINHAERVAAAAAAEGIAAPSLPYRLVAPDDARLQPDSGVLRVPYAR